MANRVEILIEVDPTGKGRDAIKKVTADVQTMGQAGRNALGSVAGGLGVPLGIAAITTALVGTGKAAIDASLAGDSAMRRLNASAKEAGLGFRESKGEADKFAESLALSSTNAEGAYAKIIQLARVAGRTGDLPDIRKKFADLAAAYGLAADDIETLANQLLSGQDEALNRLGIADPSKLYAAYAKEIGKTSNELTQQEQAQARLNAVLEKGNLHLGEADRRLASTAGAWSQLSARIDNAKKSLGDFVGERGIALINVLTPGHDYQKDEDARQRAIAAEDKRIHDEALAAALAKERRVGIQNELARALNASVKSGDYGDFSKIEFRDFETLAVSRGVAAATALRDSFKGRLNSLFKEGDPDASIVAFAEAEFKKLRGILDEGEAEKYAKEFAAYFARLGNEAAKYLKGIRDEAEKLFNTLGERYSGGGNPFVKIFTEGEEAAKHIKRTYAALGDAVVDELQKIEAEHTRQLTLGAQLDAELEAASLKRQAAGEREAATIRGLTKLEEARLSVLEKQIIAAREIPELEAKAKALREGRTGADGLGIDPARIQGEEFRRLKEELAAAQKIGGALGTEATRQVNKSLVDLFEELPPELKAAIARGEAPGRQEFAGAFESEANARRASIAEERARADREAREAARDQELGKGQLERIRAAERAGLDPKEVDKRLLGLRFDGRGFSEARAGAADREADRLLNSQKDGRDAVEKARETSERLIAATDSLAKAVRDPESRKLLIEINNRSKADVHDELYGNVKPAPVSTATRGK